MSMDIESEKGNGTLKDKRKGTPRMIPMHLHLTPMAVLVLEVVLS